MSPMFIALLSTVAVGGVAYVFLYPILSGERRVEKRMKDITVAEIEEKRKRKTADPATSRRAQVEDSLKKLEERQKSRKNPPLSVRIAQAGLTIDKKTFMIMSGAVAFVAAFLAFFMGAPLYTVAGIALAAGFGLPRWTLGYLKKRREAKFTDELPNAVDVIVRGVKAGLPIGDCIRVIATETQDPVKSEFRMIAESTAMGMPLGEACGKLYDRMPLAEANFFGIVIAIQQKAGGSLSEALANLSKVLRERKKMKAKIKAMSTEAKASAVIIAALPPSVMFLVYLTSPSYIELLWTTPTGRMLMVGSLCWMLMGTLVMRKMINFDF
jgi:tight adherence protein B